MPDHLQEAINHLDLYGYCVIEEGIPGDTAREMAHDFLTFHTQPAYQDFIHGDAYYQTLFGMMNLDDRVWTWLALERYAHLFEEGGEDADGAGGLRGSYGDR